MAPKSSIMLTSALVVLLSATAVMCNAIAGELEAKQEIGGLKQEEGIGGIFGGFGGALGALPFGDLLGGEKKLEKGELIEKKLVEKEAVKEGFLGIKGPVELVKLLFNPLELIKQIATFFKLEKLGLIEQIGKTVTFGIEIALQPVLLSIKIIEKVFVPDTCLLKFVCELGKPLSTFKGSIPKFTPGLFDGASSFKALSDGVFAHDCVHLYPCGGELKLKKEFEQLKDIKGGALTEAFDRGEGEHFGGEQNFAASNQSPSTVSKDAPLPAAVAAQ